MREFADTTRLPGNMDLFIVGSIEPDAFAKVVKSFGRFAAAKANGSKFRMSP